MELQYKCIPHSVLDTGAFHNRPQPLLLTQGLQVRSDIALSIEALRDPN